ncbi:MAG: PP2C family protein-serine/threonine phosphatase [Deltaproteobacteria bacterium]|nr:PP2C family protein-serine/threonine phosphatase [Deltaproteobacteria bacterium]MBW1961385.1 PP2C family protein-serine/threonine phosphatase [Deltaproteobacteria bacterium]MBW2151077.1 PP2C family protein-serine/threonine phosphatase [Deltaproteobacteria bacterium]
MKNGKNLLKNLISRLATAGSRPTDSEKQRLQKALLIFLTTIYCIMGLLWGIGYLALNLSDCASIPFGFVVLSAVNFFCFLRTKNYRRFRFGQLGLILVLPFFLQWRFGGFEASGAVMIWSILSPIGALMFAAPNRALPWFGSFLLLMAASGIVEGRLNPISGLPPVYVIISFIMNLGGVSAIVFFLLKYFVTERERAIAALDDAHRRVRHSLSLAMEVQQNLLPGADPKVDGLDIAGTSIYCDETGGDYYDFITPSDHGKGKIAVVVGDVSDHGIPSALLMATARALIRQRTSLPGSLTEIVSDVNRQLYRDVEDSARFMTLFYTTIDSKDKSICWISAGHEPAVVYDPIADCFEELSDSTGLPLGVFKDARFKEAKRKLASRQIIVSVTDGIMEANNPEGEMFGRERIYALIRQNASSSARTILNAIIDSLNHFANTVKPEDDMTLVVVKVK